MFRADTRFVSDHVEILYDIDVKAREVGDRPGVAWNGRRR